MGRSDIEPALQDIKKWDWTWIQTWSECKWSARTRCFYSLLTSQRALQHIHTLPLFSRESCFVRCQAADTFTHIHRLKAWGAVRRFTVLLDDPSTGPPEEPGIEPGTCQFLDDLWTPLQEGPNNRRYVLSIFARGEANRLRPWIPLIDKTRWPSCTCCSSVVPSGTSSMNISQFGYVTERSPCEWQVIMFLLWTSPTTTVLLPLMNH